MNAGFVERREDPDVGEAARTAAAQREGDSAGPASERDERVEPLHALMIRGGLAGILQLQHGGWGTVALRAAGGVRNIGALGD